MEKALARDIFLDVGHGAASFDQFAASAAVKAGIREFSASTDAHIRNIDGVVGGLPQTMSKC
jgi:dihydroorotase